MLGRFAPSPTGVLHLGSLMAAVASYLNVASVGGRWWIRIDDLDTPRVVAGSTAHILSSLESLGFEWAGVIYQSQRTDYYVQALHQLQQQGMIYGCDCSRATIVQRVGRTGCYDNHCRDLHLPLVNPQAWRVRVPADRITEVDGIQGEYGFDWSSLGDMLVRRSDAVIAYHLACAVDDADFGVTEVVRGADLLTATPPQRYLQHCLGLTSHSYEHHPVLFSPQGIKYSKASQAPAIDTAHPAEQLYRVLRLLGQNPPSALRHATRDDCWHWAKQYWQLSHIPNTLAVSETPQYAG
jgi:glutamyl-Q tRNA(Asp) synthetase